MPGARPATGERERSRRRPRCVSAADGARARRRCHHGAAMTAGHDDLRAPPTRWRPACPQPLAPLARLAYNYRWSWTPGGPELFASIDPAAGSAAGRTPCACSARSRRRRSSAPRPTARCSSAPPRSRRRSRADLERPSAEAPATPEHPIAYFCAEFGVHRSLPIYSGGLGALAGDILKEASDRALPLVAVGLMYRQGYFRQRIDAGGWQHEYWVDTDPERLPAALVTGADGEPLTVTVPVRDMQVTAQIWRVDVGRVPLYLLDAERPGERPRRRAGSRRACTSASPTRGSRSTSCSASAASARSRRWASSPASCTSTRATPRSSRSRPARAHGGPLDDGLEAARGQDDLHDAHAGPGGQRHVPGRPGGRGARRPHAPSWASTPRRSSGSAARAPTTRASRSASASSRCARAAPRTASAAATARSRAACGTTCGPTARSTTCRSAT